MARFSIKRSSWFVAIAFVGVLGVVRGDEPAQEHLSAQELIERIRSIPIEIKSFPSTKKSELEYWIEKADYSNSLRPNGEFQLNMPVDVPTRWRQGIRHISLFS